MGLFRLRRAESSWIGSRGNCCNSAMQLVRNIGNARRDHAISGTSCIIPDGRSLNANGLCWHIFAGLDWIIHADLATDRDLEAVAKAGMPIIPTATFLAVVVELGQKISAEQVQIDINRMKRHF